MQFQFICKNQIRRVGVASFHLDECRVTEAPPGGREGERKGEIVGTSIRTLMFTDSSALWVGPT